jgi:hypothetical protein
MDMTDRIKVARLLAGLTSEELSKKIGITRMNIVRWQTTGHLPLRQVRPFAEATGVPEQWLRSGGSLQGLVIARPLRVDSPAPKNVLRSNATYLAEMLPLLCPDATVSALVGASGTAYLYATQQYCLVVFALYEFGLDLGQANLKLTPVDEGIWFKAYMGDLSALMGLLRKADLDVWTKDMQNVVGSPQSHKIHTLEIHAQDTNSEQLVAAEISRFVHELMQLGGSGVKVVWSTKDKW